MLGPGSEVESVAAAPEPLSFEEIFHGGIHPENLIGVAEKVVGAQPSGHLDGAKGKLATGGAGGKDGGGQAAVEWSCTRTHKLKIRCAIVPGLSHDHSWDLKTQDRFPKLMLQTQTIRCEDPAAPAPATSHRGAETREDRKVFRSSLSTELNQVGRGYLQHIRKILLQSLRH